MHQPTYAKNQYIDDTLLNGAAGLVNANFQQLNLAHFNAGLFFSGTLAVSTNGLQATVSAALPFQVLFGSGTLASAHGTTTGQDSSTTIVDFTSVVPTSGSVVAYLAVTASTVLQDPQPLIGPPPGHPDYNPQYVPGTTYIDTLDTLVFIATTTPPDNYTTFELARCTLAAGATGLPAFDTTHRMSASVFASRSLTQTAGSVTVQPSGVNTSYVATAGATITLPPAGPNNGVVLRFSSATANSVLVQAQGSDVIYGTAGSPGNGVGSVALSQGSAIELTAQFGSWQITGGTSSAQGGGAALPPGTLLDYAGGAVPAGFLLANGQAVSRAGYPGLYSAIGTTYGTGDGSTTFNVPDTRGCVTVGLDNMGGTSRGLLDNWTTLGYTAGEQYHVLSYQELAGHSHNYSGTTGTENQAHNHTTTFGFGGGGGVQWVGGTNNPNASSINITSGTENQAHNHNYSGTTDNGNGLNDYGHNTMQPSIGVLKIIKT